MRQPSSTHRSRRYLFLAGTVGLLCAILTLLRVSLPTVPLFSQFAQFAPGDRALLLIKLLSPLFLFFLAGGWAYFFLLVFSLRRAQHGAPLTEPAPPPGSTFARFAPTERAGSKMHARLIAVPPLFQLDPAQPLPLSMLPPHHTTPTAPVWSSELEKEETQDEEAPVVQPTSPAPPDHPLTAEPVEDASEQLKGNQQAITMSDQQQPANEAQVITTPGKQAEAFSLQTPGQTPETNTPVTVSLLKQVRVWVRSEDGTTLEVKLRRGENGIRLLVFAYIAWRQGEPADRDKLLTYVIARGKRRDMNTDQLAEVFDAAKKYLRQDLDRAVNALERAGHPVEENLDFFRNEPGFYWLHPSCRVTDLETIDTHYAKILLARKEGLLDEKLDGSLPPWVIEACQHLMEAYTGDFLQTQIEKFPEECGTWIREPLTLYRDRYLDALLILANYESALGRNFLDEKLTPEQKEEQRRQHSARAAQLFFDYAMYAINSVRDRKLKFAYKAGKDGERVVMAARAIRRCVVELGKLGKPDMVDQAYLTFKERMAICSEGTWKPDKDTESDVANAKKTTSEYRFSFQTATSQHEHPQEGA